MDNQRAQQIFELANRLINLDAGTLSEQQLQQRNDMISKLKEEITTLDEASLAQMRDYFKTTDPKVRSVSPTAKYVANTDPNAKANMQKRFRSQAEYDEWLEKNGLKQISGVKEQDVAEGEQRMSRAAKGYEKYGKEGMQALAKAGREGKDLDKIRNKYNKYDTDVTEDANGEYDDEGAVLNNILQVLKNEVELPLSEYIPKNVLRSSLSPIQNLVQSAINNLSIPVNYESIQEANGEYDDEAGMAKSNLRTMARAVNGLLDTIEDNDNLPEWAQEKLAKAEMMVTGVWDYLLSQKEQGMDPKVTEASQRVDSLVTDALKIMRGSDYQVDAVKAIKTVLGDREYNSRRGFYSFYVKQLMDMQAQEGIAETKKPSPKLTAVNIKKTDPVSEEINNEAYERLQKVFAFKNYES